MIKKIVSYILLISVYGFTWVVAVVGGMIPRRRWKPTGRIMVTGTFFNPNWYLSHITPLVRSGVGEVILVIDEPQQPLEGVRFVCPPKWLAKLISRAGAKAVWMILAGLRYRPDLYMGYHIVPGGCAALVAGKLLGRPTCYQMTGSPAGLVGGFPEFVKDDRAMKGPFRVTEAMVLAIVKKFDSIVVRGNKAMKYLRHNGVSGPIEIITGSVKSCLPSAPAERDIDMIFVGRLAPVKQVHQFVAIVEGVRRAVPSVRAAIVGDGPLMADLQGYTRQLGLAENIEFFGKREDVEAFLVRSKIFVLTSKSEGLSIAMAEAMAAGAVPVVADVGDLADLVIDGSNGYLIEPGCVSGYAEKIVLLLQDPDRLDEYSLRAMERVREHCDIEVITRKWGKVFQRCGLGGRLQYAEMAT